jgi:hypothetical protein
MRSIQFGVLLVSLLVVACAPDEHVQRLIDRKEVVNTVNQLFIETDNRDWAAVRKVFADTVLFDMSSMGGGEPTRLTPRQITDGWDAGLKALEAIHHQVGNYRITLKGAEAAVFCYGTASHYLANPTGNNTRTFVGSYDITLFRRDAGWRITGFAFRLKYIDGNTNLEASASEPRQE